jgi:hypothetical protein
METSLLIALLATAAISSVTAQSEAPTQPSEAASREDRLMPHARFRPLPLGSVLPEGWLKTELRKQADGITGHQPEFCFPFDRKYWVGQEKSQDKESRNGGRWWYPWEQMGYWTDGAYRCARLLGDDRLKKMALEPIRYTLANPIEGWFLGAQRLFIAGRDPGRWPQAVFPGVGWSWRGRERCHHRRGDEAALPEGHR